MDGGLSSEQIRRMEENRRQAQERLSNKRARSIGLPLSVPIISAQRCGPPPAKRPSFTDPPLQHLDEHKVEPPSTSTHGSSYRLQYAATQGSQSLPQRSFVNSVAHTSYRPVSYTHLTLPTIYTV